MKTPKDSQRSARNLFRLCMADGQINEDAVRQVVKSLVEQKPRHFLPTLKYFRKLVEMEIRRRHVLIESAVEVTQAQRDQILSSLGTRYGGGLTAETRVNPDLLGGLRVQVGDDIYDSSVLGRLNQLKRAFS